MKFFTLIESIYFILDDFMAHLKESGNILYEFKFV